MTNALAKSFPNDPPRFLARTPHGYHDTAVIRSELEEQVSPAWLSRREPNKAAHPHRAFLPLLIVRELFFATKSRQETRENWYLQPTTWHPRLRTDMAAPRLLPKFRHT
jgi:hypothetical protein